jgi:hypothetical protein
MSTRRVKISLQLVINTYTSATFQSNNRLSPTCALKFHLSWSFRVRLSRGICFRTLIWGGEWWKRRVSLSPSSSIASRKPIAEMVRGKRAVRDDEEEVKKEEPTPKRRSSRQAAAVAAVSKAAPKRVKAATKTMMMKARQEEDGASEEVKAEPEEPQKPAKKAAPKAAPKDTKQETKKSATKAKADAAKPTSNGTRDAVTPDPDPADIPVQNPDVERHEGKCYWLLKAEPETRMEGGVDVRFSIDDLRARTKPEGWDGETSPTSLAAVCMDADSHS